MSFRFKLYRVITVLTLMVSGIFTFMVLSTVLFMGINLALIIPLMAWGACFIHSILSLYLQRSILEPTLPLKESTPGGIRIMGVIVMIFSTLMIFMSVLLVGASPEIVTEVIKQMPADQQAVINPVTLKIMGGICFCIGILLSLNANFSFVLLRQWEQQRGKHKEE
jgi:hypothetical protein